MYIKTTTESLISYSKTKGMPVINKVTTLTHVKEETAVAVICSVVDIFYVFVYSYNSQVDMNYLNMALL